MLVFYSRLAPRLVTGIVNLFSQKYQEVPRNEKIKKVNAKFKPQNTRIHTNSGSKEEKENRKKGKVRKIRRKN